MRSGSIVLSIAIAALAGCFEDTPSSSETTGDDNGTSTCEQGLLGCSCFPNGTCSADYVCFAGECREPEDATTGASGSTGPASTSSSGSTDGADSTSTSSSGSTDDGESSTSTGTEPAHILFVSSSQQSGSEIGGLAGADTICTTLGQVVRPGPWVAVLRDAVTTLEGRVAVTGEVVNTQGELLAIDGPELFSGTLQALPAYDETGTAIPNQDLAWSGSSVDDCVGWTSEEPTDLGTVGLPTDAERWLDSTVPLPCSGSPRIYCISQ